MSDSWKSPSTIIALITLLLSIAGNVFQYYNFQRDTEKWEVEKANMHIQKNNLDKRLQVFEQEHENKLQRITELRQEIDNLSLEIDNTKMEIRGAENIGMSAIGAGFRDTGIEISNATLRADAAKDRIISLIRTREKLEKEKAEKEKVYNILVGLTNSNF
jgi:chromosome segregation ATPase